MAVLDLNAATGYYSEVLFWAKKRSGATGSRLRVRLSGADRWMFSSDAYDKESRAKAIERADGDVLQGIQTLVNTKS